MVTKQYGQRAAASMRQGSLSLPCKGFPKRLAVAVFFNQML